MGIGLTFDEYVDLRRQPKEEMFPMNATAASGHLRSRGYDCKPAMLDLLVKDRAVNLAKPDSWTQEDVDKAAEYFEDCEIYTPYAAMCYTLGCRYVDFQRPLQEASERESQKYGCHISANDQYFVMHRVPPRGLFDDDDNPVGTTASVISFTLCDDIRERIERGEEV